MLDRLQRFAVLYIDHLRVTQDSVGQATNLPGHGRREQQVLTLSGQSGDDSADVGKKPHVEHVVGFVQDQGFDAIETHDPLAHQVEQAARTGNHDLGFGGQRLALTENRDAPENSGHLDLRKLGQSGDLGAYLGSQFTGWRQDQDTRTGLRAGRQNPLEGGQRKSRRLTGSRLSQAEYVAPRHGRRNGLRLNRSGLLEAERGNPALEKRVEAEVFEPEGGTRLARLALIARPVPSLRWRRPMKIACWVIVS